MGRRGCFAIGLFPLLLSIVALWFLYRDGGLVSSTQTEFLFKSSYMNPFIQRIIPHTISSGPLHRMGVEIDHGAPTATSPPMPASMSPIVRKTLPSVPVGAPSYDITMKHKRPGLVSPSIEFLSPHVPSGEGRVKFPSNMIPSMPPHIAKRIPSGGYQGKSSTSDAPKAAPHSTGRVEFPSNMIPSMPPHIAKRIPINGYQGKTSTSDAPKAAPHSTAKVSSPPRTSPLIPVSFPPSKLPLKPPSRHPIMNGMAPSMTSGVPHVINIGGHVVSPVGISPSLTNLKRHGVPVEAPPREALIPSPPLNHPPAKASSPTETPLQKHAGIPTHTAPAPLNSFPRTRKRSRIDSPAPGPSKFFRKVHGRKRVNNTAFAPSNHQGPVTAPAPIHHSKPAGVPSHAPMSFPGRHRTSGLVSSTQTEFLFKSSYMNPFIQRIIPHTISSGPLHRMGVEIDHGAPTATSPPMPASMSPIVRKTLPSVPVGAPSYDITMKHKRPGLVSPSIEFLSPHVPSGEGRVKFPSNMIPSMPPHIAKRIPSGGYQGKTSTSDAPKAAPHSTGRVEFPSNMIPSMPPHIAKRIPINGYQGKTSTSDAPKAAPHSTAKVSSPPRTSPLIPVSFPPSKLPLKPPSRHPIMNGMAPSMTSGAPHGINIGGHVVSPVGISPSLTNLKRHGVPVEAPPREALIPSPPLNHPPAKASSPTETPLQKHAGIPTHTAPAPLNSFPRTRKRSRIDSPAPGPSKFFRKVHGRKRVNNTAFAPSNHQGPVTAPAPIHHSKSAGVPSHAPMSFPGRHHTSGPFSPTESPSPSKIVPASLPSVPFPSSPVQGPIYPPKISPSHYPSKVPISAPSPVALPPPPPNQDCTAVTCTEPFTNTPPGSYCSCVWPMKVGLRLSVALYTFFPLVSELALEIATGVFMKQSQVRIMGANAASQQPEKTVVLIDLVPLGQKFDNTTAFLTYEKFWHKKVVINNGFFGDYEVLYVQYPGLPPSPPSAPTTITLNDGPFVPDSKSRGLHPLGVDVRRRKDRLNGGLIAVIVLSSVIAIVIFVGAAWFLLSKREGRSQELAPIQQALALPFVKPSGAGSTLSGSVPSSASLSFGSSIATYTGSAKTFSLGEIERATNGFDPERIIGEGGFGRVYGGVLEDGVKVAVKVLKRDDQQGGREFLAEVEMLSRLHHRNLVKLIGICTEEHNRCLVYELIPNGSVESHLHGVDKESAPLDWGARMKIALGSARGLAYLHEDSSPRVIHRDFKSSNILLEDDFTPKVSDFGLARTALEEGNDYISTRVMGTFGYVAPEYAMTGHLLVKSDVYSYGVVLLELLTGRKPVDMSQPLGQENLVTWARPLLTSKEGLETIIDPALDDKFPFDSVAKVAAIASMCVQPEVSHRPFMGEVVQALKLVCDDTDEKNGESGSCSHELSAQDIEIKITSGSSQFPETHSFVAADYNSGLEAERALSTSDILSTSARFGRQESGSFRRHSCSGPLRSGRNLQFWQTVKGMSSGSLSEHGVAPKLWAGLKRSGKWP